MPTPRELEDKFWSALKSDRTMIVGYPLITRLLFT